MRARIVFVVVIFLSFFSLNNGERDLRKLWKEWKIKYKRSYSADLKSEIERFKEFQKSAATIDHINSIQSDWTADFTLFADMSDSEKSTYLGLNMNETEMRQSDINPEPIDNYGSDNVPKEKYWEMGPVKNQWSCGSCWTFASTGALEGIHIKEHGEFRDFSEQTLLDCVYEGRRDGCNGGWTERGVNWAGSNNPIVGNSKHGYLPYTVDNAYQGSDRECKDLKAPLNNGLKRARPSARTLWHKRTDSGLEHEAGTKGPVAVAIYSSWALPWYGFGTFIGTGCGTNPIPNHAVVLAGYEEHYWYIKNSWGSYWGLKGYVYFSRSWQNLCGISKNWVSISWNPNESYDICIDTHPRERTPCVDDRILGETDCLARGCCYDPNHLNTKNQCFAKGKITVYDTEGHRRVFYGSVPDFTAVGFAWQGSSVSVEIGTWVVYGRPEYWNLPSRVLTAADGKVSIGAASVRLITSKDAMHLFEYSDFLGDVYTVSQSNNNIPKLNNDVSSYISFGSPWRLCDGTNQGGRCEDIPNGVREVIARKIKVCDDCVSSVGKARRTII